MKHQEFILTFDAGIANTLLLVQGLNRPSEDFNTLALPHTFVGQRARLEKDVNYLQCLPYALFTRTQNGRKEYLVYRRTKQVGESRLAGNASIGIGGHIDVMDVNVSPENVILLADTIAMSSFREFSEELMFKDLSPFEGALEDQLENETDSSDDFVAIEDMVPTKGVRLAQYLVDNSKVLGYLLDKEGEWVDGIPPVGQVHLGYVIEVDLADKYDARIAEEELVQVGWMTLDQLKLSDLPFEPWSKILIDEIAGAAATAAHMEENAAFAEASV